MSAATTTKALSRKAIAALTDEQLAELVRVDRDAVKRVESEMKYRKVYAGDPIKAERNRLWFEIRQGEAIQRKRQAERDAKAMQVRHAEFERMIDRDTTAERVAA